MHNVKSSEQTPLLHLKKLLLKFQVKFACPNPQINTTDFMPKLNPSMMISQMLSKKVESLPKMISKEEVNYYLTNLIGIRMKLKESGPLVLIILVVTFLLIKLQELLIWLNLKTLWTLPGNGPLKKPSCLKKI